jgi:flavin reductase (DIM6/NTAB) family NADH-FMN oxidoreductase RutF
MTAAERKRALRLLTYGLYIATSHGPAGDAAGTVTWFSQSSFEPPLVMAGIKRRSSLCRAIEASRAFAVHVVGRSQKDLAVRFFRSLRAEADTLNGYRFERGTTGSPVLTAPLAWLECRVVEDVRHGDHAVFVAEVVAGGVRSDEPALTLREAGFTYGG